MVNKDNQISTAWSLICSGRTQ